MRREAEFDALVREGQDRWLRLAHMITRDWHVARDAVQDALIGVHRGWARLPEGAARDAYLRRSVVNASLRQLRRRPKTLPLADESALPPAPGGDPADRVAAADEAWRLCAELGPVQRAAVVLRFHDDLTYADIAEVLGCPEATARSHVHRALGTLRQALEERS